MYRESHIQRRRRQRRIDICDKLTDYNREYINELLKRDESIELNSGLDQRDKATTDEIVELLDAAILRAEGVKFSHEDQYLRYLPAIITVDADDLHSTRSLVQSQVSDLERDEVETVVDTLQELSRVIRPPRRGCF